MFTTHRIPLAIQGLFTGRRRVGPESLHQLPAPGAPGSWPPLNQHLPAESSGQEEIQGMVPQACLGDTVPHMPRGAGVLFTVDSDLAMRSHKAGHLSAPFRASLGYQQLLDSLTELC